MNAVDKVRGFAGSERKGVDGSVELFRERRFVRLSIPPAIRPNFVDYLTEQGFSFRFSKTHFEEFQLFNCSPEVYAQRYYTGHYNPSGNHFFVFAIKDTLVNWLDPPPPTCREEGPSPLYRR